MSLMLNIIYNFMMMIKKKKKKKKKHRCTGAGEWGWGRVWEEK